LHTKITGKIIFATLYNDLILNNIFFKPNRCKRQDVRKQIQSIQPIILCFGLGLKFQILIPLQL